MGLFDFLKKKSTHKDEPKSEPKSDEPAQVNVESTQATVDESEKTINKETSPEVEESKTDDNQESTESIEKPEPASESDTDDGEPSHVDQPVSEPTPEETSEDDEPVTEPANTEDKAESQADETTDTDEEARYDRGLEKSRSTFGSRLNRLLANFRHVDEAFFDDLEEALIESDVGFETAMKISDSLREEVKIQNAKRPQDVQNVVIEKLVDIYEEAGKNENNQIEFAPEGPTIILFVGVNGVGKTTTIGKMAAMYKKQGKKVLLAAADTFRAGAIQQLNEWAVRDGVDIVKHKEGGDPAAVVFDGVKKAKADNYDVLFVDTAGRLQNKVNLMNELSKMKKIITREIPEAPHEVLLVLDATTGQNALNQAKLFKESTDVTGIILTKLDGTARGGIVLPIRNELHLPVKFVGLGEQVDDLRPFKPQDFVYGLFKGLIEA
ncbi:signal recognition particle-docking protein FtsY [Secundilactobacillus malefermentans]|uniref:Signal recognition particle receptor FtsY n=1 Tax=Secundilactobacillus malefermentans TaxID=176292 RepID=A0A4R5NT80_9LACO|nr:signal recognition particle-docking protein FtsY [Secundilactobacillus malefermentans]KRM59657.1 signal recognition particle-docking protein FtsY [Secundilactobacillus malefermentans DSM 5705 = KCTC 3548]QEA32435.1 signal recognition particle-docking protein FtsY [Secundilactobacillus malefermentans]TDG80388.1 hypothetical protein C5L31_000754 [Secundilactobacillus malefermentans]